MENHPIPQQISSYQFRLVGDMTLKQFFQVGGGALIAILLYSSGLPFYIKWPLIVISFIIGVALAFFPLEDRPLSKWIFLFAKSVYAPTLYLWMKSYKAPQFFQAESTQTTQALPVIPAVLLPELEKTLPEKDLPKELEQGEKQFLSNVVALDQNVEPQELNLEPQEHITESALPQQTFRQEVTVPQVAAIQVPQTQKHDVVLPEPDVQDDQALDYQVTPVSGQVSQDISMAQFSPDAAPPIPPTRANVIVGQVMDNDGKIVENAILEVKDGEGR